MNLYRDGNDCVGAHEDEDAKAHTVASFSFGEERDFAIHHHSTKRMLRKIKLENGSLFLMLPGFQREYKTTRPKRIKTSSLLLKNRHKRTRADRITKKQCYQVHKVLRLNVDYYFLWGKKRSMKK